MQGALGLRNEPTRLRRLFDRAGVPMVMVDNRRHHVEANRSARLLLRLSKGELLRYRIDDLTPEDGLPTLQAAWERLLDSGCMAGRHVVAGRDGSRLEVSYWANSGAHPELHLITFAPTVWPEDELGAGEDGQRSAGLTPREREVLMLAAEGMSGPAIAEALVISRSTVRAHLRNIYEKLDVGDRAAAVASVLRQGVIE